MKLSKIHVLEPTRTFTYVTYEKLEKCVCVFLDTKSTSKEAFRFLVLLGYKKFIQQNK